MYPDLGLGMELTTQVCAQIIINLIGIHVIIPHNSIRIQVINDTMLDLIKDQKRILHNLLL